MSGDCGLFEIGLSEQDKEIVKNEVNVIINSASCTDLNSSFRTMIKTNISSVKTLLEFAKEMKQLKVIGKKRKFFILLILFFLVFRSSVHRFFTITEGRHYR